MRLTDVPATKSNLLRLREYFRFVAAGHELLDQKREVLLEELITIHREAGHLRRQLDGELATLYRVVRETLLAQGRAPVVAEATAPAGTQELELRERSVMGVIIPLLDLQSHDRPGPACAPGWAPPGPALARRHVRRLLPALARLTEVEVSCHRLAAELQRTQRKVNALENIFIPQYRDTIHFIEGSLEEKEREALFHLKRLKSRRQPVPGADRRTGPP